MRWTRSVVVLWLALRVRADVQVNNSLASQLPGLGHVGQAFAWSFSDSTFANTAAPGPLTTGVDYEIDGLPAWCHFDGDRREFTGTPQQADEGRTWVTVNAKMDGEMDSDGFMMTVLQAPAPVLAKPLPQQLNVASSLGPENILPNGAQHIPLGWSFSIGFDGDTFTIPDGSQVYLAAHMGSGASLPGWLHFSASTNTFFGVAPTSPGPEGDSFDVVLTGSNLPGYSGPTSSFTIVVSQHALTLGGPLRLVNATVGDSFRYSIPTTGLRLDGSASPPKNVITVDADTSHFPWLSYDASNRSISGIPPSEVVPANSTTPVLLQVPLTFKDTYNNTVPANLSLNVYPPLFTSTILPNIYVDPGTPFNQSLASSIRAPVNTSGMTVTLEYNPAEAASWLLFDNTTYLLYGRPPMDPDQDRVKIYLSASTNSSSGVSQTGHSTLNVAVTGDKDPSAGNNEANNGNSGGLSQQSKVALGASLGTAGGLVLLVALMICCRRCIAVEEHDSAGHVKDYGDDDATLASGGRSPKVGYKASWQNDNGKGMNSPSTLAPSPNADHTAIKFGDAGSAYEDAVRHFQDAEAMQRPRGAEKETKPQRHQFFKSILKGQKQQPTINISHPSMHDDSLSSGLGLALDGVESDQPYGNAHSRSHHSMGSRKASWETDIFHENTANTAVQSPTQSMTPRSTASRDETPVRRAGPARRLLESAIRQRGGHNKDRPAFTATQRFENTSQAHDDLEEPEDEGDLADAQVKIVSQVSLRTVPRHHPALTANTRSTSHKVPLDEGGDSAFEDADYEPREARAALETPGQAGKRISALSYTTDHNGPGAVDGGIIFMPGPPSPNPASILGAASINSETRPEETMRAIGGSPSTPRTEQRANSRPSSRASGSEEPAQPGLGHPGEMLRVKLKLRHPLPLQGGAPGSPGKRSGRKTIHMPLLDDPASGDHLTLPDWLTWLTWDPRLCELSGTVPDNLTTACQIPLVLMARTTTAGSASPVKGSLSSHSRHNSADSGRTALGLEEEIVARILLELRPRDWVLPIRY